MKEPKTLSELIEAEAENWFDRHAFKQGASFAIPLAKAEVAREVLEGLRGLCMKYQADSIQEENGYYRRAGYKKALSDLEEILSKYLETTKPKGE